MVLQSKLPEGLATPKKASTRRNPSSKQNECAARSRSLERGGQVVGVPDQWHQCVLAKSKASLGGKPNPCRG